MSMDNSRYKHLVTERDRLKNLLKEYSHMKGKPTYGVIEQQYRTRIKQIKQLYKTHA